MKPSVLDKHLFVGEIDDKLLDFTGDSGMLCTLVVIVGFQCMAGGIYAYSQLKYPLYISCIRCNWTI